MATLYRDSSVIIDQSGIIIPRYYFPRGTPRRIPWEQLRGATRKNMSLISGRLRIWGMGLKPYWFNLDLNRPLKNTAIYLNTGSLVNPVITPEDAEIVWSLIDEHMQTTRSNEPL